jgi:hypothetical protein
MLDIECRMPDVNCAVEFCGHRYCLRAYANNTGDSDEEEDGGNDSYESESEEDEDEQDSGGDENE